MTPDETLLVSSCDLSDAWNGQQIECSDNPQIRYLVKLAHDLLRGAFFIWIWDPPSQRLSGCAYAGMELVDLNSTSVDLSADNMITRILESSEILHITASSQVDLSVFSELLEADQWSAIHCFPLRVGDKTIGAACYAQEKMQDFAPQHTIVAEHISGLASKILENEFRKREIKSLSMAASLMRSSMGFDETMQYLVDAARKLTGAESSTLFLLNTRTNSFEVGYRSPNVKTQPKSSPRSEGGLTWQIMKTGQPIRIDDTDKADNVRDSVRKRGVKSLIGVLVQLEEEKIGVLYINGSRRKQFSDWDTNFLQTLADYASQALGRSKIFLKPTEEIESALDKIFDLESTLAMMCEEIKKECQVDYISVQLMDKKEKVIESVFGTGISEKWKGLSKHYLEQTDYLRDLQADIVQTQYTEILNGNDERLDPYIYKEIQNRNIARITTPIMLFRDENSHMLEQKPTQCSWQVLANLEENDIPADYEFNENVTQFTVIGLCDADKRSTCKFSKEVIGTVGAGYQNATKIIDPEIAIKLNEVIAKWAPAIYQTSLQSVLEVIVSCAMESVKADSATLHFMHNPEDNSYVYEVCSGAIDREFLRRHPPRDGGMGWKAIDEDDPKFIPDLASEQKFDYLKTANPEIFDEGIWAIAAFPLIIDDNKGVLYIHFHRQHRFTEDEITLVKIFSKRAADAIRHATAYTAMRNSARRLFVLNTVAHSLAKTPRGENLLGDIAWITLNLFAADVVTIYEYIETEDQFITPPEIAGRLEYEPAMDTEIIKGDVPYKILEEEDNVLADDSVREERLRRSGPKRPDGREPFVVRERIKSSAGIKLKVGAEIVGLMFINYRRKHNFDEDEKKVILTLASSAAIAIKNRRMLESLSKVDKEILTTLDIDSLLNLIVQTAVEISMADVGEIRLIDYHKPGLVMKAKYPQDENGVKLTDILELDEGVCGFVATSGKPLLLKDVSAEAIYITCDYKTKSELCVPLIDKDQRIVGVLNMESYRKNTFDATHLRMLESLANRAVIAIQNAENQRRIAANQAVAEIGLFTTLISHRMITDIAGIKVAADIIRQGKIEKREICEMAQSVFDVSDAIVNEIRNYFEEIEHIIKWAEDNLNQINIKSVLSEALKAVPENISFVDEIEYKNEVCLNISEKQFIEVISNIIQNSIDAMMAMPNEGKLIVGTKKHTILNNNFIHIWIEDNGVGIPENNIKNIFNPAVSEKKHREGLGFGLWTVKKVVDRLGGEINVESQVGQGTKFVLSIPVLG
jgi:GAF domain-containing protein